MDLIFHAPYIFRAILTLMVAVLALATLRATRRRDRQSAGSVILAAAVALIAEGGLEFTALAPDAHAANIALGLGLGFTTAGMIAILGAVVVLRGSRSVNV